MTDDIDSAYTIQQTKPLASGKCGHCGLFMNGFVTCPWCGGERKVVKRERRWVGKVEI